MKRSLLLSLLFTTLFPALLLAQRDSLRDDFMNAESWLLLEEYGEALPLYMKLHRLDPENDNLNYKIGICLLNDPYQKLLAIDYLLKASKNIHPGYKENSYKERTAPPDVVFYLGNAYLVNDRIDKALESYERFLEEMDPDVYDVELVRKQIQACENARKLMSRPVDFDLLLMDSMINTRYADVNPVVSGDGRRMAFVTKLPFYDGAYFTEKVDGEWQYPRLITTELGFDADIYPVSLSWDGSEIFLYYDDDYVGNLYYSTLNDGQWSPAVKLGEPISTKYWESHASLSRDGKSLYFTSNRKGSYGGLDIYRSDRQPDGTWGEPVNLGPEVNSPYNEDTPFITSDGNTLYFSSYGHYNMGGYDVFHSRKKADGSWGEPVNMGYPINSTDDDVFFQPVENGFQAYYSLYDKSGMGRHDIFQMDVYSVDNPRMYLITGNLRTEDGTIDQGRIAIFAVDSRTGDTVMFAAPDKESGTFSMKLKQGIYDLHFSGPGYMDLIRPLEITSSSDKTGIRLQQTVEMALIPREPKIFEGEESLVQLRDTVIEGFAGRTLRIPMRLEKDGLLITKLYRDTLPVRIDTIQTDSRRTVLEIEPGEGAGRYEIEFIDDEGNIHKGGFVVEAVPPVHRRPREFKSEAGRSAGSTGETGKPGEEITAGSEDAALTETGTRGDSPSGTPGTGAGRPSESIADSTFKESSPAIGSAPGQEETVEMERRVKWTVVLFAVAGAGLILLLIFWVRRRNKEGRRE